MKTVLIGFSTIDFKGQSVLLAGPEVGDAEKSAIIAGVKTGEKPIKNVLSAATFNAQQPLQKAICPKAYAASQEKSAPKQQSETEKKK